MKKTFLSRLLISLLVVFVMAFSVACTKETKKLNNGNSDNINSKDTNGASSEQLNQKTPESGMLVQVYENVMTKMFGDMPPQQIKIDSQEQIEEMFGLKQDIIKEHYIAMPAMNVKVDTFIGIEAIDDKVSDVEKALNEYKNTVIKDRTEFPYLRDHLPKAKAAQVITCGNYVFYISLGDTSVIDDEVSEDEFQSLVDADVQKAVDIIKDVLLNY